MITDNTYVYDEKREGKIIDTKALGQRATTVLTAFENRTTAEKEASLANRKALAALGGVASLDSLEGDYMMLNIYRDNPVLDFVELRDLPLGNVPFFRTRTAPAIGFYMGSVNAMGNTYYYATQDTGQTVTPFVIQSDEIMVPSLNAIYDMNKLEQRSSGIARIARDMKIAIVNVCLNTLFGATNVVSTDPAVALVAYATGGGSFSGHNVYALDPGVNATGVPAQNYFDVSSAQNTAGVYGLTKLVFQTINDYSIQIGRRIRKIYVPSAPTSTSGKPVWRGLQDSASIVAISSGNGVQNPASAVTPDAWESFQRDDFRSVVTVNWFGLNVDIERQNWLPAGYCLVLMDEPALIMWDRLSLQTGEDHAGTLEVPVSGYMSRRSEARQIATVRPDYTLKNWLLIKVY